MQYHGSEALTYSSDVELESGAVVRISLRARSDLGIVLRGVRKPKFATKPIIAAALFPPLPPQTLQLIEWMRAYYPAPSGAIVRQFLPPTTAFPKELPTPSTEAHEPAVLPVLTADQSRALEVMQGAGSFLLHGITGSGKSRVYVELARRTVDSGRSAVILTPEIGLTPQLVRTFTDQFGPRVFVLHSQLTAANRRDVWYRILAATESVVVIGPRSALMAPVQNIGLIVLDESHDQAYKNESAPHYHAARVAAVLARLYGATFVSGSATPNVEDYYVAEQKNRPIVAMHELAKTHEFGKVEVLDVDMKSRDLFSRSHILSNPLLQHITAALNRNEQTLLFLNRRGTANVVLCSNCGWQSVCPRCDLPLSYHGDEHRLRCHVCGYHAPFPTSCPDCGNADILLKSIGTKAVLAEVERLFPQARSQRFDTDVTKADRLEQNLYSIREGSVDILVGTQLLAKGLDLPRLSLVGIISADTSLFIPDYTAAEKTFQLISQVVGRVGRGHIRGTVVVQSYEPDNPTLRAAAQQDWQKFYKTELEERRLFRFPPFTYLLKLSVARASDNAASKAANALAETLRKQHEDVSVEGPAPAFHPKLNGKFHWQIIIKSKHRPVLAQIIRQLPANWSYDIDPANLL